MIPFFSLLLAGFLLLDLAPAEIADGSVENLANRNVDFAARLYQAVASRTDDNVCLSTFALSSALSALLSATTGPTREQLSQGLGLAGLDPQTLPGMTGFWAELVSHSKLVRCQRLCSDLFQKLRSTIQQGHTVTDLKQAVAVLPSNNNEASASFRELVQTKFGGYIPNVRYSDPAEAISTINRWAQDQTGDKIQQVVSAVDAQTQLLLATVSYYQSKCLRAAVLTDGVGLPLTPTLLSFALCWIQRSSLSGHVEPVSSDS